MRKKGILLIFFIIWSSLPVALYAQQTTSIPAGTLAVQSKLQIAIEPEEIILTKGIMVGADDRKIQMSIRETSGIKNAELELVARPFTDMNSGDIVDVTTITIGLSRPQVSLTPGGLQRIELTIGGFQQAGSYIGGITIHDTVSGERKEITIRVSVKDSWRVPTFVLLASVLIASGVNHWTKKGRRKNRLDQKVAELQKTIKLAGTDTDLFLLEVEQFLEKAQEHNQEYQFDPAEAMIAGAEQKLFQYEQRKQGSEILRKNIQELLNSVRELGENDPQNSRVSGELIQLLPRIQDDYEETEAIFKQIEAFFQAYRMARRDLQVAREKLSVNLDYVKRADKSKIELILGDIDRLLMTAESMSALDEANILLRKVAFELSPEKINENMFRSQRLQNVLDQLHPQVKHVTGTQVKKIVVTWYEKAEAALEDNRYEDVDEALQKLDKTLVVVEKIKQAEKRIKGRDQKMTELRRIIRECKRYLEGTSWEAIDRAERDVVQVIEILDGVRERYDPFQPVEQQDAQTEMSDETSADRTGESPGKASNGSEEHSEQIRPLTHEDLHRNLEHLMQEALQYPKLREKVLKWQSYCRKLLEFDELTEMFEYLKIIQEELALYSRILAIHTQAEEKNLRAVLRLIEQAEQLLLGDIDEERRSYYRAEVLTDAAKALLDEKQEGSEFEHVISNIRSPKVTTKFITYGTLASYFVVATALGFQILYTPNPDFGAIVFKDYFSLVLWAFGIEGARLTATNVYEAYFRKQG
jgi:hypothetical protein